MSAENADKTADKNGGQESVFAKMRAFDWDSIRTQPNNSTNTADTAEPNAY